MLKRFTVITVIEAIFFMTVLAVFCSYRISESGDLASARSVVLYGAAIVATNAAIYAQSRKASWESLRSSRKAARVALAMVTTFAIFLVELTCAGSDSPMTPMALFGTAMIAAFGIGLWAVMLVELARDGGFQPFERYTVRQRSYPIMQSGPLKDAVDGFEAEADGAFVRQPRYLRRILASIQCGDSKYSLAEAVAALQKAVSKAEGSGRHSVLDASRWVDDFFADAIVKDIRWHAPEWRANATAIAELLNSTNALLAEGAQRDPADPRVLAIEGFERLGEVTVFQRIQAYSCIAASFSGDEESFNSSLETALANVERNFEFVTAQQNAIELVRLESEVGWAQYRPHDRYWTAPLSILAHCASAMEREREVLSVYERYISFLLDTGRCADLLAYAAMDGKVTLNYLRGGAMRKEEPGNVLA